MYIQQRLKRLLALSSVLALALAVALPAAAYSNLLKANGVSTDADATAYYAKIDPGTPGNTRLTEADFRATNGFGDPVNTLVTVTGHRNISDLGFWRKIEMVIDKRAGKVGNIAMETYNFVTAPNGTGPYKCCDSKDALSIVNMEYSPGPNGDRITKFYVYQPNDGTAGAGTRKLNTVFSLDPPHNVPLSLPNACASCHGGGLDFRARGGDTGGGWLAFDFNTFDYVDSYTNRAANEADVKKLNQGVLMTNSGVSVKNHVRGLYGGRSLPLPSQNTGYTPVDWNTDQNTKDLWNFVQRDCQGCHTLSAEDILSYNYWLPADHARNFWEQLFTLKEMPNSANGRKNWQNNSADQTLVTTFLAAHGAP